MDVQIIYFRQNLQTGQISPFGYPVHEISGFTMWIWHIIKYIAYPSSELTTIKVNNISLYFSISTLPKFIQNILLCG